jgi:hypothetical protein
LLTIVQLKGVVDQNHAVKPNEGLLRLCASALGRRFGRVAGPTGTLLLGRIERRSGDPGAITFAEHFRAAAGRECLLHLLPSWAPRVPRGSSPQGRRLDLLNRLERRFDQPVISFTDPHGLRLALFGIAAADSEPAWTNGDIPAEHTIRGFIGSP